MIITTLLNIGDAAWLADPFNTRQVTVSAIRVSIDNLGNKDEAYQFIELGTGSDAGYYHVGTMVFLTKEDAVKRIMDDIKARDKSISEWEHTELLSKEPELRDQLQRIEKLKLGKSGSNN